LRERGVEALLVEAETREQVASTVEGFGLGEGAIDGRVVRGDRAGLLVKAQGEEIVFHGTDAVEAPIEAPISVGDSLDGLGFEKTLGLSSA
jgi:hypothetical protein